MLGALGRAGSPSPPLSRMRCGALRVNGRLGEPSLPSNPDKQLPAVESVIEGPDRAWAQRRTFGFTRVIP